MINLTPSALESKGLSVDSLRPLRVAIVAGEVSGDQRAAPIVKALRQAHPDIEVRGMGGSALRNEGVDTVIDSETAGSVMGVTELFGSLRKILSSLRHMKLLLREWRPHVLVLVDYPEFNMRLARYARSLGIPVVYYIPPKLWASRSGRARALDATVNTICSIFPFEKDFFRELGFRRVTYVGHPFAEEMSDQKLASREKIRQRLREQYGLREGEKLIALFAGSRKKEIELHLEPMIKGLELLRAEGIKIQAAIVLPISRQLEIQNSVLLQQDWIHVSFDNSLEVLQGADIGLLKSGTCNLEAAYVGLPFVVFYKASALTAFIVRRISPLKEYSIVNVIRSGTAVELIQERATADEVKRELGSLIQDEEAQRAQQRAFAEIVEGLKKFDDTAAIRSEKTTAERVAAVVYGHAVVPIPFEGTMARMKRYLSAYKYRFLTAIACMIIYGASDGIVPFLVKYVLDKVFVAENSTYLLIFPIVLIVISVVRALADFGQQFLMSSIGHYIVRDIRNEMNDKVLALGPSYFLRNSSGDLISRATSDVLLVRTLLTDSVSSILRDSVRIVALIVAALMLDPLLALVAFVAFPLGVYPVQRFGKKMRRLTRKGQAAVGKISGLLNESIRGSKIVKVFCAEDYERERFESENDRLTKTLVSSERTRALIGPVNEILASFAVAAIIYYGGASVLAGTRTQGDFIAFLLAVFLLYDPFKKLSRVSGSVQQGMAGAQRIFELLDEPIAVEEYRTPIILPRRSDIELRSVSFWYEGSRRPALKNVSLSIKEGEHIALVGFSGSGKSTLVDLIPRFIDPNEGAVLIGGQDVSQVALRDLRSRISLVSQHTFLFNDTVERNILYGRPNASFEDVQRAAEQAHALEFIENLPNGFQTEVGEGGLSLSGGERQRLAIARAILKNAPILLLDEATASLDNRAEREVQHALESLEANRTSITVAHRLSTIRHADRIYVLSEGEVVEVGTHGELLSSAGAYAKLHQYQAKDLSQDDHHDYQTV
jgi:ATP-binding cassette, subfamily B, bacterial MsbA